MNTPRPRALLSLSTTFLLLAACGGEDEVARGEPAIVTGQKDTGHPAVGRIDFDNGLCTGTLIGQRTVLTAAHCLEGASSAKFTLGQNVYAASQMIGHPSYDPQAVTHDVALLVLSKNVVGVSPMQLATHPPVIGESITLVGFGDTASGADNAGTKRVASNKVAWLGSQTFSFSGSSGSQGNVCQGDSGGPSFRALGGVEYCLGIHSTASAVCGAEGNDVRVDAFFAWIAAAAKNDLATPEVPGATPPPAPGFIGEPCNSDGACSTGLCLGALPGLAFPEGSCSQRCEKTCPDQVGHPTTYCIALAGEADGYCLSSCDKSRFPQTGCRDGYLCSSAPRHGQSGTRQVCLPQSTPPPAESFIGGPCATVFECGSATARCLAGAFLGGMCTEPCERLCPDRKGWPETFCVSFDPAAEKYEGPEGHCFSRCDQSRYPGSGCRPGYRCVKAARHGQPSVQRNVCVPEQVPASGSAVAFQVADEAGDRPNPEASPRAEAQAPLTGGCAVAGAPVAPGWVLFLLVLLWRRARQGAGGSR
jgi:V8-like Glu-specific endopeptidase